MVTSFESKDGFALLNPTGKMVRGAVGPARKAGLAVQRLEVLCVASHGDSARF